MPFTGKPALMLQGARRVPNFTSKGLPINLKSQFAPFNSLLVLWANAISVLSKEIGLVMRGKNREEKNSQKLLVSRLWFLVSCLCVSAKNASLFCNCSLMEDKTLI